MPGARQDGRGVYESYWVHHEGARRPVEGGVEVQLGPRSYSCVHVLGRARVCRIA